MVRGLLCLPYDTYINFTLTIFQIYISHSQLFPLFSIITQWYKFELNIIVNNNNILIIMTIFILEGIMAN